MSVNEKMTAIADAIREKTDRTGMLDLDDMAQSVNEVYDKGKKAQYDEFWDNYNKKIIATATTKQSFAGQGWTDNTFNPTKSLTPVNAESMFQGSQIQNLAEILERNNVVFDFSKNEFFDFFAYASAIKHFPVIDITSASYNGSMFGYCSGLVTIDKLVVKAQNTYDNAFLQCSSLANIVFEGVIGNNISLSYSPLTKASITSVVNALSSTLTGKTLTLKKMAVESAFSDEEWAALVAEKSNWTISLV